LHGTAMRILRNPEQAAEVLQEVFLQIWEEAGGYDPKLGKPFHWALGLTRQKAIARLHAAKGRYRFAEEATHEMVSTSKERTPGENEFPGREQRALIRSAVESLPLEQRQAIELAFLGGLTQAEIVQTLNQPPGTIKARIRRGLMNLRDSLNA